MITKKRALGKGLSALLAGADDDDLLSPEDGERMPSGISAIPISEIETNPYQPRTEFDEQALEELSQSILTLGIIQPITVRKMGPHKYQLISGERRLRASKMGGMKEIPAYIRTADDTGMLEMALVENLQRENLNPIDIAISYQQLIEDCNLTQEKLGERVSKNRSTVTNYLRLLKLPPEIQAGLREEKISMGHARALINIADARVQIKIYRKILHNGLSVREVEDLARKIHKSKTDTGRDLKDDSFEFLGYIEKLVDHFQTNVEIKAGKSGEGKIILSYKSEDELKRIMNQIR